MEIYRQRLEPYGGLTMDLKKARKEGKIKEFVKEHDKDEKGDKERFEKALKSISSPPPQRKK